MRPLLIAALLVTAAAADASPVRRGRLDVVDNGHATLTFVLESRSRDASEVVAPIEIPIGMTATELSVAIGDGPASSSVGFRAADGRATYDDIVAQIKDPALLEYRSARRAVLHVFPVRRGEPATVVVELTATSLVAANALAHLDERDSLLAAPGVVSPERGDDYAWSWRPHVARAPSGVDVASR